MSEKSNLDPIPADGRVELALPTKAGRKQLGLSFPMIQFARIGLASDCGSRNFNLSEIIGFAEALKGLANPMLSVLFLFVSALFSVFRSRAALQAEILALRHQIGVLRHSSKRRT